MVKLGRLVGLFKDLTSKRVTYLYTDLSIGVLVALAVSYSAVLADSTLSNSHLNALSLKPVNDFDCRPSYSGSSITEINLQPLPVYCLSLEAPSVFEYSSPPGLSNIVALSESFATNVLLVKINVSHLKYAKLKVLNRFEKIYA